MHAFRDLLAATLCGVCCATLSVTASETAGLSKDDTTPWYDVELMLTDALIDPKDGKPRDIELYLGYREGVWRGYVLGFSGNSKSYREHLLKGKTYNVMDHEGSISEVTDDGTAVRLVIAMTIHADPRVSGGKATYTVTLNREGNALSGSFSGTFQNQELLHGAKKVEGEATGRVRASPCPQTVEDYVPLKPDEHPRLIFRQHELGALNKRLDTPEGKAIIERLRHLLGGGEALEPGAYTLWHGMGFGFLYQLTGNKKYAELARQSVELARQGRPDRDPRYGWCRPAGPQQAGPSIAAVAAAYDMCYAAWDPTYRQALAREIQNKVFPPAQEEDAIKGIEEDVLLPSGPSTAKKADAGPAKVGLVFGTGGEDHDPIGTGYGAWNGGGGMAVLAILGDPGTDAERLRRAHRIFRQRAKRALSWGYGNRGLFLGGQDGGRLSLNAGLVGYLQALRVALGEDWTANDTAVQWLLTKWVFGISRHGSRLLEMRKDASAGDFARGDMAGGDFSHGFGICPEAHKPAVLWHYRRVVEPGPDCTYDAITYPHRAVYAFVNWPLGIHPGEPGQVLGHVMVDSVAEQSFFRNTWGAPHDIIMGGGGLLYQGMELPFPMPQLGEVTLAERRDDGTVVVAMKCLQEHTFSTSIAVDLSGLSGAEALVIGATGEPIMTYPPGVPEEMMILLASGRPKAEAPDSLLRLKPAAVRLQNCRLQIMPLPDGKPLGVKIVGSGKHARVQIGKRLIGFDRKQVLLEEAAP